MNDLHYRRAQAQAALDRGTVRGEVVDPDAVADALRALLASLEDEDRAVGIEWRAGGAPVHGWQGVLEVEA